MDSIERLIGKLEAHHLDMKGDLEEIKKRVDALWIFRWKIAGAAVLTSFLVSAAIPIIIELWKK